MRNKLRSVFTGLSIAVSLFLVTVMYAYVNMQDETAFGVDEVRPPRGDGQARADVSRAHRARRQGAVRWRA